MYSEKRINYENYIYKIKGQYKFNRESTRKTTNYPASIVRTPGIYTNLLLLNPL